MPLRGAAIAPAAAGAGLSLTFDNARLTITASQTDETIPASGESDNVFVGLVGSATDGADRTHLSSDSGSNYDIWFFESDDPPATSVIAVGDGWGSKTGIGNSTGRYRHVATATVGNRVINQLVTTYS